jgi:hypothetical protein
MDRGLQECSVFVDQRLCMIIDYIQSDYVNSDLGRLDQKEPKRAPR